MKSEAQRILNDFSLDDHPMTTFSTEESDKGHIGDTYFLESKDKIRYFLEEGAIGPDGKLLILKEKAINKVGHGLHDLNPVFKAVSLSDKIKAIAKNNGIP